jgi:hypothetical protein
LSKTAASALRFLGSGTKSVKGEVTLGPAAGVCNETLMLVRLDSSLPSDPSMDYCIFAIGERREEATFCDSTINKKTNGMANQIK